MKIYTKTGDKGTTSLVYGQRVSKSDVRVDAYGTCDEANSMIGMALSFLGKDNKEWAGQFKETMQKVQTAFFHVGAELATPAGKEVGWKLTQEDITYLETMIDEWEKELEPLKQFILPGGSEASSALHVARTIVRRAERRAVQIEEVNPLVIAYLNRLSDFLFVAARFVNHKMNIVEPVLHQN